MIYIKNISYIFNGFQIDFLGIFTNSNNNLFNLFKS